MIQLTWLKVEFGFVLTCKFQTEFGATSWDSKFLILLVIISLKYQLVSQVLLWLVAEVVVVVFKAEQEQVVEVVAAVLLLSQQ